MTRFLTLLSIAGLVSFAAAAQPAIHYREGQRVDPSEVARILNRSAPIKTRSIKLLDNDASASASAPATLSLPVRFAFDSVEIAASARPQLDALAEGIKMLPPGVAVVVEGHTDAVGSEEYNLRLSQRRAQSVKAYLVNRHGIDARRLLDTGFGKRQPIDGVAPESPENRRVQFHGA